MMNARRFFIALVPVLCAAVQAVCAAPNPDWAEDYMRGVRLEISKHWNPAHGDASKHAIVQFSLRRDGYTNKLEVLKSSGDENFDTDALRTINTCTFAPLPKSAPDTVSVNFAFDYNVKQKATADGSRSAAKADDPITKESSFSRVFHYWMSRLWVVIAWAILILETVALLIGAVWLAIEHIKLSLARRREGTGAKAANE